MRPELSCYRAFFPAALSREDFEEIAPLGCGEHGQPPVAGDEDLDAGESFEKASVAAIAARER